MKNLQLFVTALFMFVNGRTETNCPSQFIELVATGKTTVYSDILYISTSEINIKLNNSELFFLKEMFGDSLPITEEKKELFINMFYKRRITNCKTFSVINTFVSGHKEFYEQYESDCFKIVVNGNQTFFVNSKLKTQFIDRLVSSLKKKKCDKLIIKEITYWR